MLRCINPSQVIHLMSGYELYDFGTMDGSPDHLEDFLLSSKPAEEIFMFDDMLDDSSSPEEAHHPFLVELGTHVQPQLDLNLPSSFLVLSNPGTPSQPPPPIATVSTPSTPLLNSEESLVEVIHPPPFELRHVWMAGVASMLPHDILRRAPRKRGEGKYAYSGMKYKPCTQEEFIAKVNEKISSGKYKAPVAKRQRRQRIMEVEETMDPVVVALQAQAEIYGEHFNGATNYFDWE